MHSVTRAQVLSAKHNLYVERALAGAPPWRIMLVHILPNILAPVLILAAMDLPVVISFEAGLSFLGLGVRPPTPSWADFVRWLRLHPPIALAHHGGRAGVAHHNAGLHPVRRGAARRSRSPPGWDKGDVMAAVLQVNGLKSSITRAMES